MNNKVLKYLILVALGLVIVAISSFWFSGPSFREKDVTLELEGPTQASSGDEVTYKLKYENNTRSDLSNLEVVFIYPEGSTVLSDGELIEDHTEDFVIEDLGAGEKGEKEFKAFLLGEKGAVKVARATLAFKAGTLSSTFEKSVSLSTTIVNAPISLTLVAPPSTVSGAGVQYLLDYRNTSGEDATDLILEFDYPDGFVPAEYNPQPSSGNNTWQVKSLKNGSGGRITIGGVLNGKEGESKVVSVKLKRKLGGEYVDYQKSSAVTVISNPILGLDVLVNNSGTYSASLGDRLTYSVKFSNNSNINLSGMNLVVKFEGDMFDFSTLDTRGGYFDDGTKTITWNSSIIPDFGNFYPGINSQILFTITLKSVFPSVIPGTSQDRFVKVSAKLSTPNVPTGFEGDELAVTTSLATKISTQPAFNQSAYYSDPNFGSFGPFPMRAGEETYFTIRWSLSNPGNDIDNVKIISKLPAGVSWEGSTWTNNSLPVPTFNINTAEVTWSFPRLPYGAGIVMDKYEGSFRVKVRPSVTQQGTNLDLISQAQFTGTDNFTKQTITVTRNGLNSDNLTDRPREGIVR